MQDDDDICMGSNAGVLKDFWRAGALKPGAQAGYGAPQADFICFIRWAERWSTAR